MEILCQNIVTQFKEQIKTFYAREDVLRGYFEAQNRKGQRERFPLISISIAVVTNEHRTLRSVGEVSRVATEIKKLAKSKSGNSYVVDQRKS